MSHRLRYVVEYTGLRAVGAVVNRLPYRAALTLGWLVAALGLGLWRGRRREAERRIREVFGERYGAAQVRRIAWESLRNLCFTAVEILRGPGMTREWFQRVADYGSIVDTLRAELARGHGLILACPHMGSWELAGAGAVLSGIPIFSVAGKQRNPLFDAYLQRTRERMGFEMTTRGTGNLRAILANLKAGKALALLPDVRMPTPGIRVRFLGREANVGPGMAAFARHAQVPIYPVINLRRGWARHECRLHPPIRPNPAADQAADLQRMTQAVFDIFTAAIEVEPGQWFWYNKRWIFDPLEG